MNSRPTALENLLLRTAVAAKGFMFRITVDTVTVPSLRLPGMPSSESTVSVRKTF